MVPTSLMVVARNGRHHLPSCNTKGAEMEKKVWKEMVAENWSSLLDGEEGNGRLFFHCAIIAGCAIV